MDVITVIQTVRRYAKSEEADAISAEAKPAMFEQVKGEIKSVVDRIMMEAMLGSGFSVRTFRNQDGTYAHETEAEDPNAEFPSEISVGG